MDYLSVKDTAVKWNVSERSVRNYCAEGRVKGAFLVGKTWNIPENAVKPSRKNSVKNKPRTLLNVLREEKALKMKGGIYHKIQVDLTYNSNHMEGSRLSHEQTRYIFETKTIGMQGEAVNVNDIIETVNHFYCVNLVIDSAESLLTEKFIKKLHYELKKGTDDSMKDMFCVGEYKKIPNEVGGEETVVPEHVAAAMKKLLAEYNHDNKVPKSFDEILDFHWKFEKIHPFQDGNGRVGRLILFKECLRNGIVPFIIYDNLKMYYYRGLKEWGRERGYLRDTCLTAQDKFIEYLNYFRIAY